MCERCEDMIFLLKKSQEIPGSYVASTFPVGIPRLVIPDGREYVAVRTARGDTTEDQEAAEDGE